MRLAFVTGSLVQGGAERHTIGLVNRLAQRGHDCHVANVRDDASQLERLECAAGIECMGARRYLDLRALARLAALFGRVRPAAVIAANPYALMYCAAALRRSAQRTPLVVTFHTTLQGDKTKSCDEYRKKELFEMRPFSAARLRAVLDAPGGAKTYEFEKQPPAKPGEAETWKVTRVGGSSHTADIAAMDDLLNKLVAIKAASFVSGQAKTGLDKPALVVSASYDDGKFERVRFGAVADDAFGVRDGEGAVAKLEAGSMRAAMQAFDVVVMPPSTDAKSTDKAPEKK